jgi:hypothetical protein
MSSPLKNVSVQEIEAAIAQALQALQALSAGQAFSVSISELKFDASGRRVELAMSAWVTPDEDDDMPF